MPTLKDRLPIVARWIGTDASSDGALAALDQRLVGQQSAIEALRQTTTAQQTRLDQLATGTNNDDTLLARIETLEQNLSITPDDAPAVDNSQSGRIDMLLSRMSQLEASFIPLSKNMIDDVAATTERERLAAENNDLTAKINDLESRLEQVETYAAKDNTGILLNLKIAELKRKVISGAPYSDELDLVKELVKSGAMQTNARFNEALAYLSQKAESGILTPDQLQRRFNELIPQVMTAEQLAATTSWWQSTLNSLQNMISIRKTDGSSFGEDGLDALVSNIENWLKSDDLKSVLETLRALPPAVQQLLNAWKDEIETWIASEEALQQVEMIAAENYLGTPAADEVSL